jgi:biopolymer transport protein ExbD
MIRFSRRYQHRALIDITSLIDLVFLLVAFFMVTSRLGSESSIEVNLPKAMTASQEKESRITISVKKDNTIYLNEKPVSRDKLIQRIQEMDLEADKASIIIRGDRESNYETIVSVMDALRRSGLPRFTLSTVR